MQAETGQTPPALASRPSLDTTLAMLYNDYKTVRCSRQATMAGYGRIPYSELVIFAATNGYRGSELRDFIEELQWVDNIFNEVETEHLLERRNKTAENKAPVKPPNAKQQAEQREARRNRLRPPIDGVRR